MEGRGARQSKDQEEGESGTFVFKSSGQHVLVSFTLSISLLLTNELTSIFGSRFLFRTCQLLLHATPQSVT